MCFRLLAAAVHNASRALALVNLGSVLFGALYSTQYCTIHACLLTVK